MKKEIIARLILLVVGIVMSYGIYMTRHHEYSWYVCTFCAIIGFGIVWMLVKTKGIQKRSSVYLIIPLLTLSIIEVLILKDEPAKMFMQTLCGCSLFGAGVFLLMDGEKIHRERKRIKIKHEEKNDQNNS